MKKSFSIALLIIVLLQSCVVYQHTSVPLDDAQNQGKVKVATTYGTEMKFANLYFEDSLYYGVAGTQKIRLDTTQILSVYLKDIKKSKTHTILLAISPAIIFVVFGAIFWATGANL